MKMIGKRTLSLLLCLVMILSLAGTASFAEGEDVSLYVCGTAVTESSADLFGDGKVAYDADSTTLSIYSDLEAGNGAVISYSGEGNLTIKNETDSPVTLRTSNNEKMDGLAAIDAWYGTVTLQGIFTISAVGDPMNTNYVTGIVANEVNIGSTETAADVSVSASYELKDSSINPETVSPSNACGIYCVKLSVSPNSGITVSGTDFANGTGLGVNMEGTEEQDAEISIAGIGNGFRANFSGSTAAISGYTLESVANSYQVNTTADGKNIEVAAPQQENAEESGSEEPVTTEEQPDTADQPVIDETSEATVASMEEEMLGLVADFGDGLMMANDPPIEQNNVPSEDDSANEEPQMLQATDNAVMLNTTDYKISVLDQDGNKISLTSANTTVDYRDENEDIIGRVSYNDENKTLTLSGLISAERASGDTALIEIDGNDTYTITTSQDVGTENGAILSFLASDGIATAPVYGILAPSAALILNDANLCIMVANKDASGSEYDATAIMVGTETQSGSLTIRGSTVLDVLVTKAETPSFSTIVIPYFGEQYMPIVTFGNTEETLDSEVDPADLTRYTSFKYLEIAPVSGLTLTPSSISIVAGSTTEEAIAVTADGVPVALTDVDLTSDSASATVDADGKVTGVTAGNATITASAKGYPDIRGTASVTVTASSVPVTGISLDPVSVMLEKGKTTTIVPTVSPSNATNKSILWRTDNTSVATVSDAGVVTAVAPGDAVITAEAADGSGVTQTCAVKVYAPSQVSSITLDKKTLTVYAGSSDSLYPSTAQLNATVTMQDGSTFTGTVTWTTSSPSNAAVVASSTTKGIVTGITAGSATITAVAGEKSDTCTVMIQTYIPVTGISVSPTNQTITTKGGTKSMVVSYTPADATNKTVRWTSSAPSVATVNENTGVVTAIGNGVTQITATWSGNSTICNTTQLTVNCANYGTQYTIYQNSRAWYYNAATLSDYYCYSTYPYTDAGLKVYVDNVLVGSGNYYYGSTNESSYPTYLQFYTNYMKTLAYGRHYLYLYYSDGSYAQTYFYVRSIYDAPLTGDSTNLMLWSALAAITFAGSASLLCLTQRKKKSIKKTEE